MINFIIGAILGGILTSVGIIVGVWLVWRTVK